MNFLVTAGLVPLAMSEYTALSVLHCAANTSDFDLGDRSATSRPETTTSLTAGVRSLRRGEEGPTSTTSTNVVSFGRGTPLRRYWRDQARPWVSGVVISVAGSGANASVPQRAYSGRERPRSDRVAAFPELLGWTALSLPPHPTTSAHMKQTAPVPIGRLPSMAGHDTSPAAGQARHVLGVAGVLMTRPHRVV